MNRNHISDKEKINVFLDLDNTIICSEESSANNIKIAFSYDYGFIDPYVTVARPGLQPFLDYLFENYNVCIWTAASKRYASFIFDRFIKNYNRSRDLKLLLYNVHCDMSMSRTGGSKSLTMLWDNWKLPGYNKNNTFIIDDLKEVHTIQPENCIRVKAFHIKNGENDKELLYVKNKLDAIKNKYYSS